MKNGQYRRYGIEKVTVSIVIVCMNNLKNLYPCLDSIQEYTTIDYETLVVAYLFPQENLQKLKIDYPWVTVIESNEIRGFSENNNLALRQAQGKYCFVVNDDTEMTMPVVDELVKTIESLPEKVAIVSPVTTFPDGRVQVCGRPPMSWKTMILSKFHLWSEKKGPYANKKGVFKSYNIIGAAFLIKKEIFKQIGWFDEYYFFCPEDIALSTKLNETGYECWVNANSAIIHYEGMSGASTSFIKCATAPASRIGNLRFFSNNSNLGYWALCLSMASITVVSMLYHFIKSCVKTKPNPDYIFFLSEWNSIKASLLKKKPKDAFSYYFRKYNNE